MGWRCWSASKFFQQQWNFHGLVHKLVSSWGWFKGNVACLRVKASQFPQDVPLDQSDLVAQIPSFGWLKPHWLVPLRSILVSDVSILVGSIPISFVN
jgi:hypothetical protein